jgi:hypothetical protein
MPFCAAQITGVVATDSSCSNVQFVNVRTAIYHECICCVDMLDVLFALSLQVFSLRCHCFHLLNECDKLMCQ